MTLYKNITDRALIVEGFLVEAGKTIEHKLIESVHFVAVEAEKPAPVFEASIKTVENDTLIKETKEIK